MRPSLGWAFSLSHEFSLILTLALVRQMPALAVCVADFVVFATRVTNIHRKNIRSTMAGLTFPGTDGAVCLVCWKFNSDVLRASGMSLF